MVMVMLVVAISVPPVMPTVVVCQGYAGTQKDHKSRNCEYFHYVVFHGVLLFPLNLIRLDGTRDGRVYIGVGDYREPGEPETVDTHSGKTHLSIGLYRWFQVPRVHRY